jgi:hypothetical protein
LNLARNSESQLGAPNAEISLSGHAARPRRIYFSWKKTPNKLRNFHDHDRIMTLADGHGRIDVDHPGNSAICPGEKSAASWEPAVAAMP